MFSDHANSARHRSFGFIHLRGFHLFEPERFAPTGNEQRSKRLLWTGLVCSSCPVAVARIEVIAPSEFHVTLSGKFVTLAPCG